MEMPDTALGPEPEAIVQAYERLRQRELEEQAGNAHKPAEAATGEPEKKTT